MLQYLVILLDDTSTSFCHYPTRDTERRLIDLATLKAGIRFAMVENLTIQFVYPDYELPQSHRDAIETIDHTKIKPLSAFDGETDVVVIDTAVDGWDFDTKVLSGMITVVRTPWSELARNVEKTKAVLAVAQRLNIVITDVERMTDDDRERYSEFLDELAKATEALYIDGKSPQLNLLTDRMMLTAMNNCDAGDTTVTLAPDGRFYVCPAFYGKDGDGSAGDLVSGLEIKNRQLYRLDHAPICRRCDAWQCKRCVWLNRKTTLEVNTPSHEQCVAAHLEREASRRLMLSLREKGDFLPDKEEIKKLEYLDPFDIANNWK